jgi:hypothetical protein
VIDSVFWISLASVILSILVLIGSSLAFGRILADLEYQHTAGLNGVRRIQSHVSLRTHAKRMLLGLFGLVRGIMGLMTVDLLVQYWVAGILFLILLVVFAISSVLDWFAERDSVRILFLEREAYLSGTPGPQGKRGEQGEPGDKGRSGDLEGIYSVKPVEKTAGEPT